MPGFGSCGKREAFSGPLSADERAIFPRLLWSGAGTLAAHIAFLEREIVNSFGPNLGMLQEYRGCVRFLFRDRGRQLKSRSRIQAFSIENCHRLPSSIFGARPPRVQRRNNAHSGSFGIRTGIEKLPS